MQSIATGKRDQAASLLNRRAALRSTLTAAALGASVAAGIQPARADPQADRPADPRRASPKPYRMKKSIDLWAFPYPSRMTLRECLQLAKDAGFDGIELNYDLDNDLSPRAQNGHYRSIRKLAEAIGIAISGVCSFLYWPYSLTDNDPARRARGLELARLMIDAAHEIGTENLLTIAGSTYIPWLPEREPVPIDVCDRRAREAIGQLVPLAEKRGVYLNIENIVFNGYLTTPAEMNAFVDSFGSKHVQVHFDTGNVMLFQFPEHWAPILGRRIKNVHFKEFSKKGTDHTLESFRTLLDGTTNWPAVMEALEGAGYEGYVTFEYFHPFLHYPEALIEQSSDALDRILGRKLAR
ncbi:MAG: sugar phosphate isomerase/epimerase family protein [Isosphaeraceae bacterium]